MRESCPSSNYATQVQGRRGGEEQEGREGGVEEGREGGVEERSIREGRGKWSEDA